MHPNQWYLPTFHGDILLEAKSEKETSVRAFQLTPTEERAMEVLRKHALHKPVFGDPWAKAKEFPAVGAATYRTEEGLTIVLRASIVDVQAVLSKSLKPGAKLLHAVKFSDGSLKEAPEVTDPKTQEAKVEIPKPDDKRAKPEKAATVAEPTIGCPAPAFDEAEIRATRVLEAFLDEEQIEDYRAHGSFVAQGADTGRRYIITNRHRPGRMMHVSSRSLYDLDAQMPLCVHDWTVPAPEEMLALLFCVTLPGKESAIRHLREVW